MKNSKTIWIPEDYHKALKMLAAERETSIHKVVKDALRLYLRAHTTQGPQSPKDLYSEPRNGEQKRS
jgi:predicted transcriptional regulator